MKHYWLLFPTKLINWIVNICYIKLLHPKTKLKRQEYRIQYIDDVFDVEVEPLRSGQFKAVITKNNQQLSTFRFSDPCDFLQKLTNNYALNEYVNVLLDIILKKKIDNV